MPQLPPRHRNSSLGLLGERLTLHLIRQMGWQCCEQRWRNHQQGELDLILYDPAQATLIFAEVKTRRSNRASGQEGLTATKKRRMVRMARQYLTSVSTDRVVERYRFDWFVVMPAPGTFDQWQITHWPDVIQSDEAF